MPPHLHKVLSLQHAVRFAFTHMRSIHRKDFFTCAVNSSTAWTFFLRYMRPLSPQFLLITLEPPNRRGGRKAAPPRGRARRAAPLERRLENQHHQRRWKPPDRKGEKATSPKRGEEKQHHARKVGKNSNTTWGWGCVVFSHWGPGRCGRL